jgi:hypothetical protein
VSDPQTITSIIQASDRDEVDYATWLAAQTQSQTTEAQLVRTIKALVEKGDKAQAKAEQFHIAAGQHLKTLKALHDGRGGTWAEWEAILKEECGIGKSRASELMQIADGTKTAGEVAAATTERSKKHRALSPLRNGENAQKETVPPEAEIAVAQPAKKTGAPKTAFVREYRAQIEAERAAADWRANKRAAHEAEAEQIAADLIKVDRNLATRLHAHLLDGEAIWLKNALGRGLGLEGDDITPTPAQGNGDDPGPIPACLVRIARDGAS